MCKLHPCNSFGNIPEDGGEVWIRVLISGHKTTKVKEDSVFPSSFPHFTRGDDCLMSGKYTVSVSCHFSASHTLPGCPPCDRLHGHTWRVRGEWVFTELTAGGMGADFSDLKARLEKQIRAVYDHAHLNDTPPFDRIIPTAENLAREFYHLLRTDDDPDSKGRIERVEVWEGPDNSVTYEE
jgi:6-pyruvoyltetrahydropterin/6-carboxytetrahydropterin synthase